MRTVSLPFAYMPLVDAAPAVYTETVAENDTRFRIAIAEGVTSWQVVEALKGIDVLAGEVADIPEEGTLAPESYEVSRGTPRTDLLEHVAFKQSQFSLPLAFGSNAKTEAR